MEILGIGAAGAVLTLVLTQVFCPFLWSKWELGRAVGYWLVDTPLRPVAAHVRVFITFHLPDSSILFGAGLLIGVVFYQHWGRLAFAFLVPFLVDDLIEGVSPVSYIFEYIQKGGWTVVLQQSIFMLAVYPSVFIGSFLGAWWSRARRPDENHCQRCGYNLTGLPEPRCPECGREFTAPGGAGQ